MRGEVCAECGEPATRDTEFCVQCGAFLDWSRSEQESVEGGRTEPVGTTATGGPAGSGVAAAPTVPSTVPPPRDPQPARQTAGARVTGGLPQQAVRPEEPPPPRQTVVQPAVVEPSPSGCRTCGTGNPPELRFCRKCGLEFSPPRQATAWDARPRPNVPWWRRILGGHRTPSERAALRAYRRSLPMRYRLIRAGVALLVLLLVVGAVLAVDRDPIGWATARWYDLKNTLEPVTGVTPTLDPPGAEDPVFAAINATDGNEGTAWATTWLGTGDSAGCGVPRTTGGLLLTLDAPADLREFRVLTGLPNGDPARLGQHRPRVLELRFSDGQCETRTVRDSGALQTIELAEPVSTTSVRVDVVDIFPAEGATLVAVSEIEFRQRPPG